MLMVFEMAPEMNGCTAAIMRTWPSGAIERSAARRLERAVEDRQVLGAQVGRALDGLLLVDVLDDVLRPRASRSRAAGARAARWC